MGTISHGFRKMRSLFNEPIATLLASIIGGVCALVAAFGPGVLESKKAVPTSAIPTTFINAELAPPSALVPRQSEVPVEKTLPNLTYGAWTIYASTDEAGTDFSSSILKFKSQEKSEDGLKVSGYFEWRDKVKPDLLGRETFVGNYVAATRQLFLEGQAVENFSGELAIGSYSATLSEDGRTFLNGNWGNTPGNAAGILGGWEARR